MSRPEDAVAVVLAAGKGTRMHSSQPKVLHPLAGRPMLWWPLFALQEAGFGRAVVVLGHGRAQVEASLAAAREAGLHLAIETCEQAEQLGTGDAVRSALPWLPAQGSALLLYGDCPLLRAATLQRLWQSAAEASRPLCMLTSHTDTPDGYGRIVRDDHGRIVAVREHRDCDGQELQLREVNPGVYVTVLGFLRDALATLAASSASGELYLTDLVQRAAERGGVVDQPADIGELRGVNDRWELAQAEAVLRQRILADWARRGVSVVDPASTSIEAGVQLEADVRLEPQVHLRGRCHIGRGATIDVGCVLRDVRVAAGAVLKPYTVASESTVGAGAQVGPFAHLRSHTTLGEEVRIGNFVETKQAVFGRAAKANHLAYVGDADVGAEANLGAGTICCNYAGFRKHRTTVEAGAFVGSDSQLVAPVRIGAGAYVATGTTVTQDVPSGGFAISRVRQVTKGEGYAARLKAKLKRGG